MKENLQDIKKEAWSLLKENQKGFEEIREAQKENQKGFEEIREAQKENQKGFEEIREAQKKTSEQIDKTTEQIKEICGDYNNRFGKLGENLTKGGLVQELKKRGIEVDKFITNIESKKSGLEFDIIAVNGTEVVVVEVKNTLRSSDVRKFSHILKKQFKEVFPEYKDKKVYGAVAYLLSSRHKANELARKEGFFVIETTGSIIIKNDKGFKPKVF